MGAFSGGSSVQYRRIDAYLAEDDMVVSIETSTIEDAVYASVWDSQGGNFIGGASFANDSIWADTVTLMHINMVVKNKGYGSRLLRILYNRYWGGARFVRIWNAAKGAYIFYGRLGFIRRSSECLRGEMWFRPHGDTALDWPAVREFDIGIGPRSRILRRLQRLPPTVLAMEVT